MKLCSIASGSSGNCIYVGNNQTHILVDAGISAKKIENGLNSIDIQPSALQGILITHEHSDHIAGLGVLAKRYQIPIYGTVETLREIRGKKGASELPDELFHRIAPNQGFQINDIAIEPFSISHDASNPVCYTMQSNGYKVGIATDLGMYDDYIIDKLKDSDALMIEANHDVNMLMVGKYPYYLKQRILGRFGHLSNESSANLISRLLNQKLRYVLLGHLSKENNMEELAYETVCCELNNQGCDLNHLKLSVARREDPSPIVIL